MQILWLTIPGLIFKPQILKIFSTFVYKEYVLWQTDPRSKQLDQILPGSSIECDKPCQTWIILQILMLPMVPEKQHLIFSPSSTFVEDKNYAILTMLHQSFPEITSKWVDLFQAPPSYHTWSIFSDLQQYNVTESVTQYWYKAMIIWIVMNCSNLI